VKIFPSIVKRIIINLVPNELGRFIYKSIFSIEFFIIKHLLKKDMQAWYRNSLLQSYFCFGLSDIDVSVELKKDKSIQSNSKKILTFFTICPLIKEINFYYPFCINELPIIGNFFELSKDPYLLTKVQVPTISSEVKEAQAFTYLFRMFFSNLNQIKKGISKRDIQKWSFHFKRTEYPEIIPSLFEVKNYQDLLHIIFGLFPAFDKSYHFAAKHAAHCHLIQMPLHTQFEESEFPLEILTLLPQLFCFKPLHLNELSEFGEKVFIEQMSWEVLGMLTQPMLFYKASPVYQHLANIKSALEKASFNEASCEERKLHLIKILNQFSEILQN
jgi:hypothetical protein